MQTHIDIHKHTSTSTNTHRHPQTILHTRTHAPTHTHACKQVRTTHMHTQPNMVPREVPGRGRPSSAQHHRQRSLSEAAHTGGLQQFGGRELDAPRGPSQQQEHYQLSIRPAAGGGNNIHKLPVRPRSAGQAYNGARGVACVCNFVCNVYVCFFFGFT